MKKLILSCFILLLALISCSPKQENKTDGRFKWWQQSFEPFIDKSDTSQNQYETEEITEKDAKVIFKGWVNEYGDIASVIYNENDILVYANNLIEMKAVITVQDDIIIELNYLDYENNDTIKVYKECNKGSESFFVTKKELRFHKIQGIKDWLYLSADYPEVDNFGFVYVYDISEKSYYGNIEERKKSGNYNTWSSAEEYEIIQRYKNIKRYGPLLIINHNNKTIEFWNSFNGLDEINVTQYNLLDYYPNYNEILIRAGFWEGSLTSIFNLETGGSCLADNPYFNSSRTYMITLVVPYVEGSLLIYAVNNGLYTTLEEIEIEYYNIKNVVWLNDNNAQITFNDSSSMLVEIGEEVKITRK